MSGYKVDINMDNANTGPSMREPGFYWVKYKGVLEVAQWVKEYGCWFFAGFEESYHDDELEYIDEKRLTHE